MMLNIPSATNALLAPPPVLGDREALDLLMQHWGLRGTLTKLSSERDLNFRLTTLSGCYVLKLANIHEPPLVTHFQTQALIHLEKTVSDLQVPRVIRTTYGATEAITPHGTLRLLSYVSGEMMHSAPPSQALRASLGRTAAQICMGLKGFSHPADQNPLMWDIKNASNLRHMIDDIADPDTRRLAVAVLDHFDTHVQNQLLKCRWQVIHSDLNPHNVVVDAQNPTRVVGVIDFGDMVRTPMVCEVAIAASYQLGTDAAHNLGVVTHSFHQILPLEMNELLLVYDLVMARLVTTVTITSHRAKRFAQNAPYILRNFASAQQGLFALAKVGRASIHQDLIHLCPMEP
jgi:Ser/Thr protein kinase RdoA (MazF antagonist)